MSYKKTRLMIITHDLAIGGLQQVIVNICRTLNRKIFDVSVLCLRDGGDFLPIVEKMRIKVHFLPQKEKTDYFSFFKIAKILKREKIEVVHTHNTQPFIEGGIGAILARVKTIIHTDHARNFPDKRRYMFAEWLISHFVYKIVGVSEHTSKNLMLYEKISSHKIVTIYNGIDTSKYDINVDKNQKRAELYIKNSGPIIGLGVRLTEQKGILYLLKAMPAVVECFPNISLIIAGDGDVKNQLISECKNLGIEKHVFFVGPRLDMIEILKILDLYVLPSIWEGLPMVLLEAMAAGCTIIATNVGGNSIAIRNGDNGILVEAKDSGMLATEIIKLLKNERVRENYAKKSFELFNKKFTAEIMTKKYEQLYFREDI